MSGDYLVISVGGAATSALYFNVCGWANPSDAFPTSTPFNVVPPPVDTLPAPDNYEWATGATPTDTATLATDLAYYAVHGQYPTSAAPPAEQGIAFTCSGEPSVS